VGDKHKGDVLDIIN